MAEGYQALYRRYRSKRFAELRGQPHVVRALRTAVAEDRVGHAYLFSGPRGTGKTSTARILAKALNCDAPVDGEPCGVCEHCLSVDEGRMVDWLQEHDAASNRGIDRMKEILERIPLGTSGRRKVVILDEVHMLTPQASNALLKSLEEPPAHVVYILATTDPHLVLPTIRSRTQHFEFHLLPTEELADHVRWIIEDAGLDLGEDAVAHVLRVGGGSARDTLSALDQVAALGGVPDDAEPVEAVIDALRGHDPGAALVAVADAVTAGREPRALAAALVARLRDAFLARMGAADRHLPEADLERAVSLGEALGAGGLTRTLELLGEAMVDISRKPDARLALELALVRSCRADLDLDVATLAARVEQLENRLARSAAGGAASQGSPDPAPSAPFEADRARARLAGRDLPAGPVPTRRRGRREDGSPSGSAVADPGADSESAASSDEARASAVGADASEAVPSVAALAQAWEGAVLGHLPNGARSMYRLGHFVEGDEGVATFALPNSPHRDHCEKKRPEVERALAEHFGRPVPLRLVVGAVPPAQVAAQPTGSHALDGPEPADEPVGLDEVRALPDAPDESTGVERLARAFPGAKLIDEP